MKTSKQFAEDVIQRFQHDWESENLEFVLKHFKKLESRHLGDRDSLILEVKDFTNDFENNIYNRLHWLYFKMFPETTTKEIGDYKPILKRVFNEVKECDYRQLVFNVAECIYLHKIKQERDKILLDVGSNSNTQISPLEASNTETDKSTPQNRENLSEVVSNSFSFMLQNDPRKHKQILSSDDHHNLITWVTKYFENGLKVPMIEKPINEFNTTKGNVIYTFKNLFKEVHPEKTYPESLWNLIRACFYSLRNDNSDALRKTKKPQYYNHLPHNR